MIIATTISTVRTMAEVLPLTARLPQALQTLPLVFMLPARALVRGLKDFLPQ